jgi:hypothetical protein
MKLEQIIADWFKETWGGSLLLPSGWFGRPYDNCHQLSSVISNSTKLVVVLDEGQLKLNFEGVPKIETTKSELIFSSFNRLTFEWKEYGSLKPHFEVHEGGQVKIIAPPGA